MTTVVIKIISGGQTGVDRGALDAALAAGIPCGGWCPAGRRAEDGPLAAHYPLCETATAHYVERTRQNVIDSDGTLIIYFGALAGGSARTLAFCQELHKPCYTLDAERYTAAQAAPLIQAFIQEHGIMALNVAGPRASKQARAHSYTQTTIGLLVNRNPASDDGRE
jgi:hypothetical protein